MPLADWSGERESYQLSSHHEFFYQTKRTHVIVTAGANLSNDTSRYKKVVSKRGTNSLMEQELYWCKEDYA
ncbi:hypothetical protein E2C01_017910 [Portunus trituberculatus]|uniref:Uncharacterized protein n=1 Tax=Portunus trituberculatus TaxID=210409 RepID=A0A5B7DV38_PORTR|nr:hypothetical protein [Portunus trituberculatus]